MDEKARGERPAVLDCEVGDGAARLRAERPSQQQALLLVLLVVLIAVLCPKQLGRARRPARFHAVKHS